ncbi:MAG: DUF1801 domain-containing protein [Cyclobacteriaceae bacterium]|nr:DUF1801 domain-containing protein [Cyclobacteriaceae bacterium HetDA_MAG_MS6]
MDFDSTFELQDLIKNYPTKAQQKLAELRQLIIDTAKETKGVNKLLETTKWGEPSYVTKTGSTIRMDWKERVPDKYYLYFICTTQLVDTFRIIFGDELQFEGNRAIALDLDRPIPSDALKRCIVLALTYKKVKDLPMLGV